MNSQRKVCPYEQNKTATLLECSDLSFNTVVPNFPYTKGNKYEDYLNVLAKQANSYIDVHSMLA